MKSLSFLAILTLWTSLVTAQETRYPGKWEWNALEANEIKKLANAAKGGGDGFWELYRNGVMSRSDVSGRLAAEASTHVSKAIKAFPKAIPLPASPTRAKNVRFMVTIHQTEDTYHTATEDADPDEGFAKISPQDDGSTHAEIHLVNKWKVHPGFDNNLVECVDVGILQGHLARILLQLWRPDAPLPPFLAKGYESYFETYDVYKEKSREVGIHRSEFRNALQKAILHDQALRPSLPGMLSLTEAQFGESPELNGALASRLIHFLKTNREYPISIHQLLASKTGTESTKVNFKMAATLENGWHLNMYRGLASSRPILHTDLAAEGKLPGAASVTNRSAYGNKPSLSLMPAPGGSYDLAWHSQGTIRIMQCDAEGKKTKEFSPSFIQKAGALLGATRLPEDKGYVVGYCLDNSHGNKNSEFWVAGFGPDGTEKFNTRIFGEKNHKEVNSKGGPGGAGSARIVYNDRTNTIAFYLANNQLFGDGVRHQGGYIGFLNESGKRLSGGSGWFYSHNFDQRLIVANGDFCALAHGDAYPRALGFSRWPGSGGKAIANQTYHQIEGESGANTTNCQTGDLVAIANRKYAVVFASSNGREAHDVCLKILDESGKTVREKWLTNYEEGGSGSFPRIARDGEHIFVAWHEGGQFQQMVLNKNLETIIPQTSTTDVRLSPYDDFHNLDNGAIAWAVPVGGNKIRVHRIDPPAVLEQKLIARNKQTERSAKPETIAEVDRQMTLKLAELNADKKLPKTDLQLSVSPQPMRLTSVDTAGLLQFTSTEGKALQPTTFSDLPLPDRANLTLALSEQEPDNLFLYGIAGFYLECSGSLDAATYFYGKAGQTIADQFAKFFEE